MSKGGKQLRRKAITSASALAAFGSITSFTAIPARLETHTLFEPTTSSSNLSPLDELIANTDALNIIALKAPVITKELSALLLLGYVSAVESFIRSLIRGIVNVDEVAQRCVEPKLVPFGAALHHEKEMLPEALFEGVSFSSKKNLVDAVKDFVGVSNLAADLGPLLDEFQRICELRHCCVHRFGRLGAKNAIALGLAEHHPVLESCLLLNQSSFQELALRLRTFAKALDNALFTRVLMRTASNVDDQGVGPLYSVNWTWNFQRDRKRFIRYYQVFASKSDAVPSPAPFDIYSRFRSAHAAHAVGMAA